jgi:hypothetical protein
MTIVGDGIGNACLGCGENGHGGYGSCEGGGGGGGAYGGKGGDGGDGGWCGHDPPYGGDGGESYGSLNNIDIYEGSKGGNGGGLGGIGRLGGGAISLFCDAINIEGRVSANGANGEKGDLDDGGGGGGSRGGILIATSSLFIGSDSLLSVRGGNGGDGGTYGGYHGGGGGGGSGGRIKIFYSINATFNGTTYSPLNCNELLKAISRNVDLSGGAGGLRGGPRATNGTSGDDGTISCIAFQKGMSYAAWWHDTYATNGSDISLENLKETCTEWVSLVVTWYQDNASSTEIDHDDKRTPTDDSLIHAIDKIHSLNMSVMLKPTVDLQDEKWRGTIGFDNITYSDALGLGWQDWSWDCNRNFESTMYVYRGKYAINVSFKPWGGLSFANPEGVNTEHYDKLEFYINGGESGGQQLRLSLTDDDGNELPSYGGISINNPKYVHDGVISAKTWKLVSIPLEDLNATNTKIIKINIMDNTGHAQPPLYIDDVLLTALQSKWNVWFSSYEQFILHYADLAEEHNVEQFCVGVEYKGTVHRDNEWRDIIAKIRGHYTDPITYASNWDNYQNINWWDASDFVGIDTYFPLTNKTDPSIDELKEGWKKWGNEIEIWQAGVNKRIIFTEIGYCSMDGTNIEPWNWTYSDTIDLQEQADCYNAAFQTFWCKPWLAGIYWWMWDPNPNVGGPSDKSYTPYKKLAEDVLKKYYCAEKLDFDTGHGEYPSIMGTHTGTIKPRCACLYAKNVHISMPRNRWAF